MGSDSQSRIHSAMISVKIQCMIRTTTGTWAGAPRPEGQFEFRWLRRLIGSALGPFLVELSAQPG